MTYHAFASSSNWFHKDGWIDFHTWGSYHAEVNHPKSYLAAIADWNLPDPKPTLNSEPCYEGHGINYAIEDNGTFTSTDRTVQRVRKAIEPLEGCRDDAQIIGEIGRLMGYEGLTYGSSEEIMNEIASVTPSYGGISYGRLEQGGIPWPCPTPGHPGTPYLHKDQFSRGRGKFFPVEYTPPAELPDREYPLTLTTGRVLFHYHTGTMTRKSPTLNTQLSEGYAEMNPADAAALEISQGESVRVISRRGEIAIKARITHIIPAGTVFIPFHFAEAAANVLTSGSSLDPVAKIPELKVCAIRIEKAG